MTRPEWNWPRVAAACLSLLACAAHALPEDRQQPIEVSADSAERDEKAGTTTYTGRVQVDQGTIRIEADKVVLFTEGKKVTRINAVGQPAKFQQQPEPNKGLVHAQGLTMDYLVSEEHVVLQQNARMEQDGSVVQGDRIDYYVNQRLVKAAADKSAPQKRVRVVIPPEQANGN